MIQTLAAILDHHLAQPRTTYDAMLIRAVTELRPLAGDKDALLREIDRRMIEGNREEYALAKSPEPRTPEYWQRVELLRTRFLGLGRLQDGIKAAL